MAGTREVAHGKIKIILYSLPLTVKFGLGEGGKKLEDLGSGKLEGFGDPVRLWGFSLLFFGSAALNNHQSLSWLRRLRLLPGV